MSIVFAVVGLLVIAAYLYAGDRVWHHMVATDHDTQFDRNYRAGKLPGWVYHVFLVLWAPLVAVASLYRIVMPSPSP